jgi:predicted ATPase
LVGRELEAGFLAERWEQAQAGAGQAVLLSGEPGIGKSRLTNELRVQVEHHDHAVPLAFQCSPYAQNSAFHPIIERLSQVLQLRPEDAPEHKVGKLCEALRPYRFPQAETLALFARLLSLPAPADRPPLTLSPQRQKQKTQEALVAWFIEAAEQRAVYAIWEDLHWADSSTLEVLSLLLDQLPTARILAVLTYRPEFSPPWPVRSHMSQFTLGRLGQAQMEAMVTTVTGGKPLPQALMAEVARKTDGIPLFVEEFTKVVVESDWLHETDGQYALTGPLPTLAIPSTLQDSLMARLDRLATAKAVAQLGATIGREFSYALLAAISPFGEETLSEGLRQLVAAELVYQRGLPPDAQYQFKHALIQDTAYQSLLKRTRQQYHQQIAEVLAQQFTEVAATQPELLAQHYTEAGLTEQAIEYWQKAGQHASDRSAYEEALSHVTTGLTLLQTLPETLTRQQQELALQLALGTVTLTVRGYAALEVEAAYTRARVLCQQLGATQDVSPVLYGLWLFYVVQGDLPLARQLGEALLGLATQWDEMPLCVIAHMTLGATSYCLGELLSARRHLEEGIVRYTPAQRSSPLFRVGADPGVGCHSFAALTLWSLGYPDQALARVQDGLALAPELAHPYSTAFALFFAAYVYQFRREGQDVSDHADAAMTLSTEQGFAAYLAQGTILRGWAVTTQEQDEEGLRQMRHGLTAWRASGAELVVPYFLVLLAEAYARLGQVEAGLAVLQEGWEVMDRTGERSHHAEMSRLKGALLLQQHGQVQAEAEACFQQAIAVAQQQRAKSWELRAATSLARLWQSQAKQAEARQLLGEIYGWFTEGFDTKDLQEAQALLEELV